MQRLHQPPVTRNIIHRGRAEFPLHYCFMTSNVLYRLKALKAFGDMFVMTVDVRDVGLAFNETSQNKLIFTIVIKSCS